VMTELPASSESPPWADPSATAFNKHLEIAGYEMGDRDILVWSDPAATPLRLPPGGEDQGSVRLMVGDNGDVVASFSATGEWVMVLHDGLWQDIGGLGDFKRTLAAAVNHHGQIVGRSAVYSRGFRGQQFHPYIWEDGVMRDLGVLETFDCEDGQHVDCGYGEANDINDRGVVVGTSSTSPGQAAWRWVDGVMENIGLGNASRINDRGQILGFFMSTGSYGLWENGAVQPIQSSDGSITVAFALGEKGDVVGWNFILPSFDKRAFVWRDGQMTDLGPGAAVTVNRDGDVLVNTGGCAFGRCDGRAILWRRLSGVTP
jgi:probable HAF family extracellular repeat protein